MSKVFDRFRNKNLNRIVSETKMNKQFILNGYPSVEIKFLDGHTQMVSLVNKQEKDYAYVYSDYHQPLQIGDIFTSKGLTFLITDNIVIMKNVGFHKYTAVICNADLGNGEWGYFKGPAKSYINVSLTEDMTELSQQKPILIARQGLFKVNDIIWIKDRPWLIIECDNISSPVIGYYSLKATTASKKDDNPIIKIDNIPVLQSFSSDFEVKPLEILDLNTEDGYYKCSKNMPNLNISLNKISFTIPFGIEEFEVSFKENGEVKTRNYKVVE